jgi:hypothetical protein
VKRELVLKTEDCPEANGRKPLVGETEYTLRLPLDDGRELVVRVGEKTFQKVADFITDMLAGTPNYNDGTTNLK